MHEFSTDIQTWILYQENSQFSFLGESGWGVSGMGVLTATNFT